MTLVEAKKKEFFTQMVIVALFLGLVVGIVCYSILRFPAGDRPGGQAGEVERP
jgi:L-cystine uptake protein TcyP (sodium:dicarboxylate symporter family)